MIDKLQRCWSLFVKSVKAITANKKLLIFPLISGAVLLLLILLIVGGVTALLLLCPSLLTEGGEAAAEQDAQSGNPILEFAVFAISYLIFMLVATVCNVAFVSQIFQSLRQEPVSVRAGFRFAFGRFKAILYWSLLASTVGVILNMLQERAGFLGSIALKIIGVVWAVASCFAIPCIIFDPALNNPLEVLRRSGATIKKTWGEALIGFVGFQSLIMLSVISYIIFCVAGAVAAVAVPVLIIPGVLFGGIATIALFGFIYLVSTAQQIYQSALYLYAQGQLVGDFTVEDMTGAFKTKGK